MDTIIKTPRTDETFTRTMKFAGKVDACETFALFARGLEREIHFAHASRDRLAATLRLIADQQTSWSVARTIALDALKEVE